jgi:hypothetical protein
MCGTLGKFEVLLVILLYLRLFSLICDFSLDYLPPEMVTSKAHSREVDYWCVGVLCFEFLCGKPAFETATTQETYNMIARAKFSFPDHVSNGARDLIKKVCFNAPMQLTYLILVASR